MADPQQNELVDLLLNDKPLSSGANTSKGTAKKYTPPAVGAPPPRSSSKAPAYTSQPAGASGRGKQAQAHEPERGGDWEEYVRMLAEGPPAAGPYAMGPMFAPGPFMYNPPMGMVNVGWGLAPVAMHPYGPPMAVPLAAYSPQEPMAVPVAPMAVPVARPAAAPRAASPPSSEPAAPPLPATKPKSWANVATSPASASASAPAPVPAPASPPAVASEPVSATPTSPTASSLQAAALSAGGLAPAQRAATAAAVKAIADSPAQLVGINPAPGQFHSKPPSSRQFVIKSFSEDDVHKSIKYGIWASTDNGNRRLDAAYREASSRQSPVPVYLFFSVNGSGQFCGMAQMTSPLDFTKKADVWAQDKWNGCFTVKWIFIKDIPNTALRHIRLPNNEDKPVTNSRDTTEVLQEQGWEVLKVFAEYRHKTCLLDDFAYYEQRTALLREKQQQQHTQKQQHQQQDQSPAPAEAASSSTATPQKGRNNRK